MEKKQIYQVTIAVQHGAPIIIAFDSQSSLLDYINENNITMYVVQLIDFYSNEKCCD